MALRLIVRTTNTADPCLLNVYIFISHGKGRVAGDEEERTATAGGGLSSADIQTNTHLAHRAEQRRLEFGKRGLLVVVLPIPPINKTTRHPPPITILSVSLVSPRQSTPVVECLACGGGWTEFWLLMYYWDRLVRRQNKIHPPRHNTTTDR